MIQLFETFLVGFKQKQVWTFEHEGINQFEFVLNTNRVDSKV